MAVVVDLVPHPNGTNMHLDVRPGATDESAAPDSRVGGGVGRKAGRVGTVSICAMAARCAFNERVLIRGNFHSVRVGRGYQRIGYS